ncbi:MAG: DUF268 domain-containing protein [Gammaproteobacteria bacterium]|nr:DUF268 domain-containing protein [Gammaproteobacteria bacterium]MBU1647634.1 DUF268 domain-containing protein [Gammaproteobacteria bacterium]MBU1971522.1 DUF268 domain-containing protein [Gammaproteobacteria bacterium]
MSIRDILTTRPVLKRLALFLFRAKAPFGSFAPFAALMGYLRLFSDWRRFRSLGGQANVLDFYPCLFDKRAKSSIDAHYFHQAVWAIRKIFQAGPLRHVDIGSDVNFVGMLTAVVPVTFVDIRPLELTIPNYEGLNGSILFMPFPDASVESLSSLHVIEHIGLGRYGDPVDPKGSLKAAREVVRVLAPGGHAYISVPLGRPRVQFNGQRIFDVPQILSMFAGLRLATFSRVDPAGLIVFDADPNEALPSDAGVGSDYGLGLFEFIKGDA